MQPKTVFSSWTQQNVLTFAEQKLQHHKANLFIDPAVQWDLWIEDTLKCKGSVYREVSVISERVLFQGCSILANHWTILRRKKTKFSSNPIFLSKRMGVVRFMALSIFSPVSLSPVARSCSALHRSNIPGSHDSHMWVLLVCVVAAPALSFLSHVSAKLKCRDSYNGRLKSKSLPFSTIV